MRRKNSSVILIVGLLSFSWLAYILASLIFVEKKSENINYIPKNVDATALVDLRLLVGETAFSLLFKKNNFTIFDKIQDQNKNLKDENILSLGINTLNKVVVFAKYANETDSSYIGYIFNLNQENLWDRNLDKVLGKQQIGHRNGNVGVIITCNLGSKKSSTGKEMIIIPNRIKMMTYAKQILKSKSNQKFELHNFENLTLAKVNSRIKNGLFSEVIADVQMENGGLNISGILDISEKGKNFFHPSKYTLGENGLQISTSLITPEISSNLIKDLNSKFGLNVPIANFNAVNKITLNYRGLTLITNKSTFPGLPIVDLLIELKDTLLLSELTSNEVLQKELKVKIENNTIDFGSIKYHLKQIDSKTVYIGQDSNPKIIKQNNNVLLQLRGDITSLTNVQGKGFVYGFITTNPFFNSFQAFFKNVQDFDLKLVRQNEKEAILQGSLACKENKSVLLETLNLILSLGSE